MGVDGARLFAARAGRRVPLVALLFFSLLLTGVGPASAPHLSTVPLASSPSLAPSLAGLTTSPSGAYIDYSVIIIMENHAICDILRGGLDGCTSGAGPYETGLALQSGLATKYRDCSHPSLPNYLCLTGASSFGCTGYDGGPHSNNCTWAAWNATNIVDRLVAGGLTWEAFMENMPSNCYGSTSGKYAVKHDPFVYYKDIVQNQSRCSRVVPAGTGDSALLNSLNSTTTASNYMWLTPNLCNDMHDCSVATGDTYLKGLVPKILNSPVFATQRAALFITFDEDSGGSGAPYLYTVWSGPAAKQGFVSSNAYNHFSLLKTLEVNWNLPALNSNDSGAASMSGFFTTGPSFSLSASPQSVGFYAGQSASTVVTLDSLNGFSGTVALSATSTPAGVAASFSPSSLTGSGTSTCTLTSTSPGSYAITITGTSGGLVRNTTVSAIVAKPLTATFTFSPSNPSPGQTVNFTANASGGKPPYAYAWQFGDGAAGSGASVAHAYASSGTYAVNLTVTDASSNTFLVTHDVVVAAPPPPGPPQVATVTASAIGATNATLQANLASLGGAYSVSVGFTYGTDSGLVGATNVTVETTPAPTVFTLNASGLVSNTTYYFRAWAEGTSFATGSTLSFTTSALPRPPSPTAVLHVQGTSGSNGWYVSSVTLTVTTTDPSGPLAWTLYRVDGSAWTNYSSSFQLGDGRHVVEFYAEDMYGSAPEADQWVNVSVDTAPPAFQRLAPEGTVTTSAVAVTWNATDAISGIARYEIQVDGGAFQSVGRATSTTINLGDGSHTIAVRASDVAGNEAIETTVVRVDTNPFSPTGPVAGIPTYTLLALAAVGVGIALAWPRRKRGGKRP